MKQDYSSGTQDYKKKTDSEKCPPFASRLPTPFPFPLFSIHPPSIPCNPSLKFLVYSSCISYVQINKQVLVYFLISSYVRSS